MLLPLQSIVVHVLRFLGVLANKCFLRSNIDHDFVAKTYFELGWTPILLYYVCVHTVAAAVPATLVALATSVLSSCEPKRAGHVTRASIVLDYLEHGAGGSAKARLFLFGNRLRQRGGIALLGQRALRATC